MSEIRCPRSLAFVVQSDVLGPTAVSIPAEWDDSDPDWLCAKVERAAIEDEIDGLETTYLESHEAKVNPFHIDREELRRVAQKRIEQGETWGSIAARIGWIKKSSNGPESFVPDGDRVKRALGFREDGHHYRATLTDEDALEIGRALDLDPVDIGL